MKLNFTTCIILLCFLFAGTNKISGQEIIKEKKNSKNFELSFGQSVLFISNSDQIDLLTNFKYFPKYENYTCGVLTTEL